MSTIVIDIHTIDWTEGEHCALALMIAEGLHATVTWGDGKTQTVYGKKNKTNEELVWQKMNHCYRHKNHDYTIEIMSNSDDAIIGFSGLDMFEQTTLRLDVSNCPSLEILEYCTCEPYILDVSHNPRLKRIKAIEVGNEKIDFSANPLLEELDLRQSENLTSLNLNKNDRLRKLNVCFYSHLHKISLSNKSMLNWVDSQGTNLYPRDREHLLKILERNTP